MVGDEKITSEIEKLGSNPEVELAKISNLKTINENFKSSFETKVKNTENQIYLDNVVKIREIIKDPNSFYRAIVFFFLEGLIFRSDFNEIDIFIKEFNNFFDSGYTAYNSLDEDKVKSYKSIDLHAFNEEIEIIKKYFCHSNTRNSRDYYINEAHKFFVSKINQNQNFEKALILYFRLKIYDTIENFEKSWNMQMIIKFQQSVLENYENKKKYYNEILLNDLVEPDDFVKEVISKVLGINLNIVILNNEGFEFKLSQFTENPNNNDVLTFIEFDDKIFLGICSEYYEKYKLYFENLESIGEHEGTITGQTPRLSKSIDKDMSKIPILNFKTLNIDNSKNKLSDRSQVPKSKSILKKSNFAIENTTPNNLSSTVLKYENQIKDFSSTLRSPFKKVTNLFRKCVLDVEDVKEVGIPYTQRSPNKIKTQPEIFMSLTHCIKCKEILFEEPIFKQCLSCINGEIKNKLINRYFDYIKRSIEDLKHNQGFDEVIRNYDKRFDQNNAPSIILKGNDQILLSDLENLTKRPLYSILEEVKKLFCVVCQKSFSNQKIEFSSDCGCNLCSLSCYTEYFLILIKNSRKSIIQCVCRYTFSISEIHKIYSISVNPEVGDSIRDYLTNKFNALCLCCEKDNHIENLIKFKIEFKFAKLTEMLDWSGFHIVCIDCYNTQKYKKKQILFCSRCREDHELTGIVPMNQEEIELMNHESNENICLIY